MRSNSISDTSDLSVLEKLPGIIALILDDNQITDPSALTPYLTWVVNLDLDRNQIGQIGPLDLPNLRNLSMEQNDITNVDALSGLVNLEWLFLSYNQIEDITGLANLTSLTDLCLGIPHWHYDFEFQCNLVTDLSPLIGLVELETLSLNGNAIIDIGALVLNKGFGAGDTIYLRNNDLDCKDPVTLDYLEILEGRVYKLYHDC